MRKLLIVTLIFKSLVFYSAIADVKSESSDREEDHLNNIKIRSNIKDNQKKSNLIWKKIINENTSNDLIKWKYLNDSEKKPGYINTFEDKESKLQNLINLERKNKIPLTSLYLGHSVPIANTLKEGEVRISFSQFAPMKESYNGGATGNQNYLALVEYGLRENLSISSFYSHSDDPLHVKINNLAKQPSNLWVSYGASFTWKKSLKESLRIALNGSLESWQVKSGGCNLYRCSGQTNNIFNSSLNEVENNNLIGSLSIPVTLNLTKNLQVSFAPRAIFLPSKQGNSDGSGEFYGNNFGFGSGIEYKPIDRLKLFSSAYIPIGSGKNAFDSNINFIKRTIFTSGAYYSLDPKIAFAASVSNGFGLTPSTAILTLPSSNELLYGLQVIYRPSNYTNLYTRPIYTKENIFDGLSVSNANLISETKTRFRGNINSKGSWYSRFDLGLSESFNLDISLASINQNYDPSSTFSYHSINETFYRGGGKIKLYTNQNESIISSARLSAGRLKGTGWIFGEIMNTFSLNKKLKLNLNPKISKSGIANPAGIGASLNWEIMPRIKLIPETNIAIKEATSNWTLALRISPSTNKFIDIFTTNSLSFLDTGQLLKSEHQSHGINIGTVF